MQKMNDKAPDDEIVVTLPTSLLDVIRAGKNAQPDECSAAWQTVAGVVTDALMKLAREAGTTEARLAVVVSVAHNAIKLDPKQGDTFMAVSLDKVDPFILVSLVQHVAGAVDNLIRAESMAALREKVAGGTLQ